MSSSGLSQHSKLMIEELNNMHGEARGKILELIKSLRKDKLKDHEIRKILLERVNFISRSSIYEYMPQELKREYKKPELPAIQKTYKPDIIDVPESRPHEEEELPPEMQAFAAKYDPHNVEDDQTAVIYEIPEPIALYKLETCRDNILRQLMKLKAEGWKVAKITARRIT